MRTRKPDAGTEPERAEPQAPAALPPVPCLFLLACAAANVDPDAVAAYRKVDNGVQLEMPNGMSYTVAAERLQ